MVKSYDELCRNPGLLLLESLPAEIASLKLDSPILTHNDAALDFSRDIHQGCYFSYKRNSAHPHTMHEETPRGKLKVFMKGENLLRPKIIDNPHIPPVQKQMLRDLYAALEGDAPVDALVDGLLEYGEIVAQYIKACKLWGGLRPVSMQRKDVTLRHEYEEFRLRTSYATPQRFRELVDNYHSTNVIQTWDRDKHNPITHPVGEWSTATSPRYPRIIYSDLSGAANPVLAFTKDGTACHFLDMLCQTPDYFERGIEEKIPLPTRLFRDHVVATMKQPVAVCIAGGDLFGSRDYIGGVVRGVKRCLNAQLVVNFTQKTSPAQTDFGLEYLSVNQSSGFIFIPRQLSTSRWNELLMLDDDSSAVFRKGRDRILYD